MSLCAMMMQLIVAVCQVLKRIFVVKRVSRQVYDVGASEPASVICLKREQLHQKHRDILLPSEIDTMRAVHEQTLSSQLVIERVRTHKPNRYKDGNIWWTSFEAYAVCQDVQLSGVNAFLLAFMDESSISLTRRQIKEVRFESLSAVYAHVRRCFEIQDVSASQLIAKLLLRDQYADESLLSYYNDLWDWVERIDRVKPFHSSLDEEVMMAFMIALSWRE